MLIAQLRQNGLLSGDDLANMLRRLHEGEMPEAHAELMGIILSDDLDTPEERRAIIYPIDGGNQGD